MPPSPAETSTRSAAAQIGRELRTDKSTVAALTPQSPLGDFVRCGVKNHPAVAAAYLEWRASVAAVAPTRALPDPKLTFEADIARTLMTAMPGLMFDVMTPGKRAAMGRESLGAAAVAYRAYASEVVAVAARIRKTAIELAYVDEALRLRQANLVALDQAAEVANSEYTTGAGMSSLEVQVQLANDVAKVRSEMEALGDRRLAARAGFKASLGLVPDDPDPAWPRLTLVATPLPKADRLWARARVANPELGRMRAMIEMAVASVDVARRAGTPDFAVGAMVDVKANPLMVRPSASVSLPIWREKIRENIAAAEVRRDAAAARMNAEEVDLAAELAQMFYMVRESDRMIAYIDGVALPNYERAIASVEASYQSGMGGPAMIPATRVMEIGMRLERLTALRDRELAVTDLLAMTADVTPAGVPLLAETAATPVQN